MPLHPRSTRTGYVSSATVPPIPRHKNTYSSRSDAGIDRVASLQDRCKAACPLPLPRQAELRFEYGETCMLLCFFVGRDDEVSGARTVCKRKRKVMQGSLSVGGEINEMRRLIQKLDSEYS